MDGPSKALGSFSAESGSEEESPTLEAVAAWIEALVVVLGRCCSRYVRVGRGGDDRQKRSRSSPGKERNARAEGSRLEQLRNSCRGGKMRIFRGLLEGGANGWPLSAGPYGKVLETAVVLEPENHQRTDRRSDRRQFLGRNLKCIRSGE